MQPEFKKATDAVGVAELITLSQNPESCLSSDFFPPKKYFFVIYVGTQVLLLFKKFSTERKNFLKKNSRWRFSTPATRRRRRRRRQRRRYLAGLEIFV